MFTQQKISAEFIRATAQTKPSKWVYCRVNHPLEKVSKFEYIREDDPRLVEWYKNNPVRPEILVNDLNSQPPDIKLGVNLTQTVKTEDPNADSISRKNSLDNPVKSDDMLSPHQKLPPSPDDSNSEMDFGTAPKIELGSKNSTSSEIKLDDIEPIKIENTSSNRIELENEKEKIKESNSNNSICNLQSSPVKNVAPVEISKPKAVIPSIPAVPNATKFDIIPEMTEQLWQAIKQDTKINSCTMSSSSQASPPWTRKETENLIKYVNLYGERFYKIHDLWEKYAQPNENEKKAQEKEKQEAAKEGANEQKEEGSKEEKDGKDPLGSEKPAEPAPAQKPEKSGLGLHSRLVDEIKARWYQIRNCHLRLNNRENEVLHFDLEQEVRRKEQLNVWFNRPKEQVIEEIHLVNELSLLQERRRQRMVQAAKIYNFCKTMQAELDRKKNLNDSEPGAASQEASSYIGSINSTLNNSNSASKKSQARQVPKSQFIKSSKQITHHNLFNNSNFNLSPKLVQNEEGAYISDSLNISPKFNGQPFHYLQNHTRSGHSTFMRSTSMNLVRKQDLQQQAASNRKGPQNKNIAPNYFKYCQEIGKYPMCSNKTVEAYNNLRCDLSRLTELKCNLDEIDREIVNLREKRKRNDSSLQRT